MEMLASIPRSEAVLRLIACFWGVHLTGVRDLPPRAHPERTYAPTLWSLLASIVRGLEGSRLDRGAVAQSARPCASALSPSVSTK
jgi:hypothetical protein